MLVTSKGVQQPESYSTHFNLVAGKSRVKYSITNLTGQRERGVFQA